MKTSGKNVLILEDIEDYQNLISNIVKDFNFNIIETISSTEKVLDFILENSKNLDLIILDSLVGGHVEVWEIAKKINKKTDISIIFITIPEYENRDLKLNNVRKLFIDINKNNGEFYEQELKNNIKLSLNKYKSNQKLKNDKKIIKKNY